MYSVLLIFILILSMFFIPFYIQSVISADDGFFVVPDDDEFFNPGDYGGEPSLSSEAGNYSEKFKSEDELYNTNPEKLTGFVNFTEFNFALAGDWGCTKNTAKCGFNSKS